MDTQSLDNKGAGTPYGLTPRALSKQLKRLESIIGKRIGYSYREEQILGIFENLGAPPFARVVLREHL